MLHAGHFVDLFGMNLRERDRESVCLGKIVIHGDTSINTIITNKNVNL